MSSGGKSSLERSIGSNGGDIMYWKKQSFEKVGNKCNNNKATKMGPSDSSALKLDGSHDGQVGRLVM
jgi:hypothetical protein